MAYEDLTVPELKDLLRERGLPLSGKKADLIERLTAVLAAAQATNEHAPAPAVQTQGQAEVEMELDSPDAPDAAEEVVAPDVIACAPTAVSLAAPSNASPMAKLSINVNAAGAATLRITVLNTSIQNEVHTPAEVVAEDVVAEPSADTAAVADVSAQMESD